MLDMRVSCLRHELTDQELIAVSAQYLGLAIASMNLSVENQVDMMAAAGRITNTACLARTAVKQGAAWPLQPPDPRRHRGDRE